MLFKLRPFPFIVSACHEDFAGNLVAPTHSTHNSSVHPRSRFKFKIALNSEFQQTIELQKCKQIRSTDAHNAVAMGGGVRVRFLLVPKR